MNNESSCILEMSSGPGRPANPREPGLRISGPCLARVWLVAEPDPGSTGARRSPGGSGWLVARARHGPRRPAQLQQPNGSFKSRRANFFWGGGGL